MIRLKIQKSFKEEKETGTLYLVGTPIGNLGDITYRAVETLKSVDIIAAEDTRQTIKLLNHFGIQKRLLSYHEHNKEESGRKLVNLLNKGESIALVSDAGMPAISDPGYELVVEAIDQGITVVPIPGANAAITGLVASGLPTKRFAFMGFLSRDKKEIKQELEQLKYVSKTMMFYEAPHRIKKTVEAMLNVLGNRKMVFIRELTKKHEEFIRGTTEDILQFVKDTPVKGECMLLVEGSSEEKRNEEQENSWWFHLSVQEHVMAYIDQEISTKEAIKMVAIERNVSKREIYKQYHNI